MEPSYGEGLQMSDVRSPAEYGGWIGGGGSATGGTSTGGTSTGGGTGGATAEGAAGAKVARKGAMGGGVTAHAMTVLSIPRPRHSIRRRATISCLPCVHQPSESRWCGAAFLI